MRCLHSFLWRKSVWQNESEECWAICPVMCVCCEAGVSSRCESCPLQPAETRKKVGRGLSLWVQLWLTDAITCSLSLSLSLSFSLPLNSISIQNERIFLRLSLSLFEFSPLFFPSRWTSFFFLLFFGDWFPCCSFLEPSLIICQSSFVWGPCCPSVHVLCVGKCICLGLGSITAWGQGSTLTWGWEVLWKIFPVIGMHSPPAAHSNFVLFYGIYEWDSWGIILFCFMGYKCPLSFILYSPPQTQHRTHIG